MLFYLLQNYQNIKRAVINDINPRLINAYTVIRDNPYSLIEILTKLQTSFRSLTGHESQKDFYLNIRALFNKGNITDIEDAAYMIFLNKTCFNGLYRENSKGEFNVPFGRYTNPTICDENLILADSELLQKVEIINDDFSITESFIDEYTFFYFDPPYRPLDATSNFNSYVKEAFDDREQIRLKDFYSHLTQQGCYGMLSNSDCKGRNEADSFFDELYKDFIIERVYARRHINSNASKRGTLTELLIRNYDDCQGDTKSLF